jgi:hypothetical protein
MKLISNQELIHFNDVRGLRMIRQEVEVSDNKGIADTTNNTNYETVDVVGIEIRYSNPLKKLILMKLMTWEWKSWDSLYNYLHTIFEGASLPNYEGKTKQKDKSPYPAQKIDYVAYSPKYREYQRGSIRLDKKKWIDPVHEWRQEGRVLDGN